MSHFQHNLKVLFGTHLRLLGRDFRFCWCRSCFGSELHVWDRWSKRLFFGRSFVFSGRSFLSSLTFRLVVPLHHRQFGAGFDGTLPRRWRTAPDLGLASSGLGGAACATDSCGSRAALFGGCARNRLLFRAFTSLGEESICKISPQQEVSEPFYKCTRYLLGLRLWVQHGQGSGKLLILMDLFLQLSKSKVKIQNV